MYFTCLFFQAQPVYFTQMNITDEMCVVMVPYIQWLVMVSYVDTVLTLLLPFLVLIILLALITLAIMQSIRKKQKRSLVKSRFDNGTNTNLPQVRVAKMLYMLSLSVVILNASNHCFRLKLLFSGAQNPDGWDIILLSILQFVSFISFAVKFFICLVFSKNVRKLVKVYFCCGLLRRYQSEPSTTVETRAL